jgi:hypothetical protein
MGWGGRSSHFSEKMARSATYLGGKCFPFLRTQIRKPKALIHTRIIPASILVIKTFYDVNEEIVGEVACGSLCRENKNNPPVGLVILAATSTALHL